MPDESLPFEDGPRVRLIPHTGSRSLK